MNKRQRKKRFKQTHIGIPPEMWRIYEENRKRWMSQIIFREYANILDQGTPRSVAAEKLMERLVKNYGFHINEKEPVYKKKKFDKNDIIGGH